MWERNAAVRAPELRRGHSVLLLYSEAADQLQG